MRMTVSRRISVVFLALRISIAGSDRCVCAGRMLDVLVLSTYRCHYPSSPPTYTHMVRCMYMVRIALAIFTLNKLKVVHQCLWTDWWLDAIDVHIYYFHRD